MHFARVMKCERKSGSHRDCHEGTTHICIRDTVCVMHIVAVGNI